MSITHGHFTLSTEQKRFKDLLSRYPPLLPYWDFEKREVRLDELERAMGTFSHGERLMASFFKALWDGQYKEEFDFYDAAWVLDDTTRKIIADWFADPFFP